MGNLSKLFGPMLDEWNKETHLERWQSAIEMYESGWRARVHKASRYKYFTRSEGTEVDQVTEEHLPLFMELVNVELSSTWKERHAKGTPVVISWTGLNNFLSRLPNHDRHALYGISGYDLKEGGSPYATQMAEGLKATFCNFRYKEKGGEDV